MQVKIHVILNQKKMLIFGPSVLSCILGKKMCSSNSILESENNGASQHDIKTFATFYKTDNFLIF